MTYPNRLIRSPAGRRGMTKTEDGCEKGSKWKGENEHVKTYLSQKTIHKYILHSSHTSTRPLQRPYVLSNLFRRFMFPISIAIHPGSSAMVKTPLIQSSIVIIQYTVPTSKGLDFFVTVVYYLLSLYADCAW